MIKTIYKVEFEQFDREGFTSVEYFLFKTEKEARDFMKLNIVYSNVRRLEIVTLDVDEEDTNSDLNYLYDNYLEQFDTLQVDYHMLSQTHGEIDFNELRDDVFFENEEEFVNLFGEDYWIEEFISDIPYSENINKIELELEKYQQFDVVDKLVEQYKNTIKELVINKKEDEKYDTL